MASARYTSPGTKKAIDGCKASVCSKRATMKVARKLPSSPASSQGRRCRRRRMGGSSIASRACRPSRVMPAKRWMSSTCSRRRMCSSAEAGTTPTRRPWASVTGMALSSWCSASDATRSWSVSGCTLGKWAVTAWSRRMSRGRASRVASGTMPSRCSPVSITHTRSMHLLGRAISWVKTSATVWSGVARGTSATAWRPAVSLWRGGAGGSCSVRGGVATGVAVALGFDMGAPVRGRCVCPSSVRSVVFTAGSDLAHPPPPCGAAALNRVEQTQSGAVLGCLGSIGLQCASRLRTAAFGVNGAQRMEVSPC